MSEKNLLKEERLSQLIATYFGVKYVDLKDKRISEKILDYVPEELARSHRGSHQSRTRESKAATRVEAIICGIARGTRVCDGLS